MGRSLVNGVAGPAHRSAFTSTKTARCAAPTARLVLDLTSDQGCFAVPVSLVLEENQCQLFGAGYPKPTSIAITNDSLNSCGDGDGGADPGEMVEVSVVVKNIGEQAAATSS